MNSFGGLLELFLDRLEGLLKTIEVEGPGGPRVEVPGGPRVECEVEVEVPGGLMIEVAGGPRVEVDVEVEVLGGLMIEVEGWLIPGGRISPWESMIGEIALLEPSVALSLEPSVAFLAPSEPLSSPVSPFDVQRMAAAAGSVVVALSMESARTSSTTWQPSSPIGREAATIRLPRRLLVGLQRTPWRESRWLWRTRRGTF